MAIYSIQERKLTGLYLFYSKYVQPHQQSCIFRGMTANEKIKINIDKYEKKEKSLGRLRAKIY